MAHKEQTQFCEAVKKLFPDFFYKKTVIDVGSLDINGSNESLFRKCWYEGIDIVAGKNVDHVGKAHEVIPKIGTTAKFSLIKRQYLLHLTTDVMISTECLEHDADWKMTLAAMYDYLKPGGLMLITCASEGRAEHGTTACDPKCSPGTNDYYKNVTFDMFSSVIKPELFKTYYLNYDTGWNDLQFYGIKKFN